MKAVSVLPLDQDDHVEMALPWYVNGTLAAAERADVELHLSVCAQCRASHHLEVLLQQQLRVHDEAGECEPQSGWATLVGRLETPFVATKAPKARRRLMSVLLLAQAAAIVALSWVLISVLNESGTASYRTFTEAPSPVDATAPTLRVVFADNITSAGIRELLTGIGGTISAGPGPNNIYTVRLTSAYRSDEAAMWLRSQTGVLFAESVNLQVSD
jgi:hypothetical protein